MEVQAQPVMKMLIIGGTRYMGRIAVQRMLERGDKVTVFSRGSQKPEWWPRVHHIAGDRKDRADFEAKLRGKQFDAVIDTQAFRKEDVESAVRVFDGNVGRYLMVSTGSVYLDGKLDFVRHCPFKESDVDWASLDYTYPPGESEYAVGKRHCEKWLQENSRVPYTVIRIPAVMGWDDPSGRMWWWVQRALDGREVVLPMGEHGPFRTLYCADASENWLRAIDSPVAENEIIHIATEEVITPEQWVHVIWRAAGHEGQITWVPREMIDMQDHLKGYQPPLTRSWPYIHDLSKASRCFDFRTMPLEEWVATTVNWYRDRYRGDDSKGYSHRNEELALAARWRDAFQKLMPS